MICVWMLWNALKEYTRSEKLIISLSKCTTCVRMRLLPGIYRFWQLRSSLNASRRCDENYMFVLSTVMFSKSRNHFILPDTLWNRLLLTTHVQRNNTTSLSGLVLAVTFLLISLKATSSRQCYSNASLHVHCYCLENKRYISLSIQIVLSLYMR